jgi:hypothetical protein
MSLGAYPMGSEELTNDPRWLDRLWAILRVRLGRAPTSEDAENAPEEAKQQATNDLLVILHAERAERLPNECWKSKPTGDQYYLIDDPDLRSTFGVAIGKVARSHWWSVDALPHELGFPLGAPAGFPNDWVVDPLKLGCLLRVADASHLDERRAPGFLRAVRRPTGVELEHWTFQNNLLQPQLGVDRLVYTSKRPFKLEEATAWWLCFDALQMVDRELHAVDALLSDLKKPRFRARGVERVEDPQRLAELIHTDGWLPIDARVKVSDVASLAARIGGRQLYGDDLTIPLRELIQNASDAIRARRLVDERSDDWGHIRVRTGRDEKGYWVEVEDNGLGMSMHVLTGPLLDFGVSYWGSELMQQEHPGLSRKGFEPTGQYGIGFFSVFMWGDNVQVSTRQYRDSLQDTRVLDFQGGLGFRPVLRMASGPECLRDGGTRVRVYMGQPLSSPAVLPPRPPPPYYRLEFKNLVEVCEWLCPALEVDLWVESDGLPPTKCVSAGDWKTIDGERLLLRIAGPEEQREEKKDFEAAKPVVMRSVEANLRTLRDPSRQPIGRASISPEWYSRDGRAIADYGIVTAGGIRTGMVHGMAGVLAGIPLRATRDFAIPVVGAEELARWATEQSGLAPQDKNIAHWQLVHYAELVRDCGGSTGDLPIAWSSDGLKSANVITEMAKTLAEVLLWNGYSSWTHRSVTLDNAVLVPDPGDRRLSIGVSMTRSPLRRRNYRHVWPLHNSRTLNHLRQLFAKYNVAFNTLRAAVIEALAEGWGAPLEEVLKASSFPNSGREDSPRRVVGRRGFGKRRYFAVVDVIRNPRTSG